MRKGFLPFSCFAALAVATLLTGIEARAGGLPTFSKTFAPDTIGPGSVTTLTFVMTNQDPMEVTTLAFTDTLPAGVTLATPANAGTDCVDATLGAADGGSTVTFSGGRLPGFGSCTVTVDVTSSTVGVHTNVSGDLTSSFGNSGNATDDLTVATNRPGFSKSFAPSAIGLGGRSTLTFTIDNSANPALVFFVSFMDNLPTGMIVADPANALTDCTGGTLTAVPGTGLIALGGASILSAGATCTVSVDVTGVDVGTHINVSGELLSTTGGPTISSGKATATLTVTGGTPSFTKAFLDDPVNPGGTVTLELTLTNLDRNFSLTNIAFTDDLDATLSGLVATGLPMNDICGTGSVLSGTSLLSLTGGTLAADGGSCTVSVTLQVPAGALAGAYPNVTSSVTADLNGSPIVGPPATETLFVNDAPLLTKTFLTNPVGAGDTVSVEFTITNTSSTSTATNIAFLDNLSGFLSGVSVSSLPAAGFCGAGSSITTTTIGADLTLAMSGGNLAAGGSCTFTVDLLIPVGAPPGPYLNVTGPISALVDDFTQEGQGAADTLNVVGAPRLQKAFTDDPVAPGGTVTLEFTITQDPMAAAGATDIAFTDDLTAALSGLTATGLPMNDVCGVGSVLSGTTNLSFTGGILAVGEICTFSVTLQVPAGALPGVYTNQTSMVMATSGGTTVIGNQAVDDLTITGLTLSKAFTDDPVIPGDLVTLEFTLDNTNSTLDATGILFFDNLGSVLPGLVAEAPLPPLPCGAGSSITGTNLLIFTGGDLLAGTSCTFSVNVRVPAGAADGVYGNLTSDLTATVNGSTVTLPAAADSLTVNGELLLFTKSFTDDPVQPGSTVTLEFTLMNTDATQAVTGMTFTDDLDAALTGLVAMGLPAMDVCGVGSMISGTGLLTLSGGTLAAGASCTFSVTLMVPAGVALGTTATNTTSDVTGMAGGFPVSGTPASDDLQIDFMAFTKAFDGLTVAGGTPVLTFTIENLSTTSSVADISFTDDLDAVIAGLVATGLPLNDVCGMGSVLSGTSFLALTGGNLLPAGSCTFMVPLQVPAAATAGTFPNTTSDLFLAGLFAANPATADLTVEPPPTFAKVFLPDAIGLGQGATLIFTLDNTASVLGASSLDFTDNLPAGVLVATPANATTTCTGGTVTAASGTATISYTGGMVAAGASCTVQADVVGNTLGALVNTTGDLTSSSGNSGTATATLTVNPQPGFAKVFAPNSILVTGVSTLTLTIDNTGSTLAAAALDFADTLPAGVVVATPGNAATTCTGGTLTATDGSGAIAYTGGSVAAGASCTVQADVTSVAAGMHVNTTGDLTSSLGNSGTATDTLTVNFLPLAFSKTFAPTVIQTGEVSLLTLTIDNTANPVAVPNVAFTDPLPAGVVIATPANASTTCTGGTLSAPAGGATISYSGGTVPAGTTCTVGVDVTGTTAGSQVNTTGDLTSDAGTTAPATATLTVIEDLVFTKAFPSNPVLPAGFLDLEYTITNTSVLAAINGMTFMDDFDATLPGLVAIGLPAMDVCGAGSSISGTGLVTFSDGSLPPGGSCTFTITLQVPANAPQGTFTSVSSLLSFAPVLPPLGGGSQAGPATDDFTVAFLAFEKAFPADPVQAGSIVPLTFMITNPDPVNTATDLAFTDDLEAVLPGLAAVGLPMNDVCGVGSLVDGTSILNFTGGILGPNESCIFEIMVQVPADSAGGEFTNVTSVLSSTVNGTPVDGDPAGVATDILNIRAVAVVIPALGTWGLILLMGLLSFLAVRRLRAS